MKAAEIFALGYAIPFRDIVADTDEWVFESERIVLRAWSVPIQSLPGVKFHVSLIEDVRRAAHG